MMIFKKWIFFNNPRRGIWGVLGAKPVIRSVYDTSKCLKTIVSPDNGPQVKRGRGQQKSLGWGGVVVVGVGFK